MGIVEQQVFHMIGGAGETSYANNSLPIRKLMIKKVKPILEECIKRLCCTITLPGCLQVADLGCSSGPNTLLFASNIINIVHETSRSLILETPIFQIFLNDLFGNDFNSVFKSLPEFYHTLKEQKGVNFVPCFMHATPGTFYGRLFPNNSIHFFHCSYSLNWLSQDLEGLSGEAKQLNYKDNIYVTSINPPAYVESYKKDFKLYLRSRSEELVLGGGMLLTFIGRYETSEMITARGLIHNVLNDMVSENLVNEAKVKCFSMPAYFPTAQEVREIIKDEGSFIVERLESIEMSWDGSNLDEDGSDSFVDDNEQRGVFIARYARAVFEPILKAHFGEGIMDELFLRVQNKVVQFMEKLKYPALVISLTKNA